MWNAAQVGMLRAGIPKRPCSKPPFPHCLVSGGFILRKIGFRNPPGPLNPQRCLRNTQRHPVVVFGSVDSYEIERPTELPLTSDQLGDLELVT